MLLFPSTSSGNVRIGNEDDSIAELAETISVVL